jgi:hypothetical protein
VSAVRSALSLTTWRRLRTWRRARETDAQGKIGLLRRVQRQYALCTLPRFTESAIEQSWNEQVFARVLGYQTMLAHDRLPFHLKPKHYSAGYYDDFSLGFFGAGSDRVLASAELKGPRTNLDRDQSGRKGKRSPVAQAIQKARATSGCLWVLVSNFQDLRLYRAEDALLIADADLNAVRTSHDLAMLQAHFDSTALLGDGREDPEMRRALEEADDPARPLPPAPESYRIVARFVPKVEREFLASEIEAELRSSILQSPALRRFVQAPDYGRQATLPVTLRAGWVRFERSDDTRGLSVAMSQLGEIEISCRFARQRTPFQMKDRLSVIGHDAISSLRMLTSIANQVYSRRAGAEGQVVPGIVNAEFLDVHDAVLFSDDFIGPSGLWGISESAEIQSGDVAWNVGEEPPNLPAARCVADLAVYFRRPEGGFLVDVQELRELIRAFDEEDGGASLRIARQFGLRGELQAQ